MLNKTSIYRWSEFYNKGRHKLKCIYNSIMLTTVQKFFFKKICKNIQYYLEKGNKKVSLLSFGSGIDFVSNKIKKKYNNKVSITIVDVSQQCIDKNKEIFGDKFEYRCENILNYPSSEEHHIIYNTGLLEHFPDEKKIEMLNIIEANLIEGGRYLTLNPSKTGYLYSRQMELAKRRGKWPFGYEKPLSSLSSFQSKDFYIVEEILCCSIFQFRFFFLNHKASYVFLPIVLLDDLGLISFLEPLVSHFIGQYGLFTVFEKERINKSRDN